jgi:enterochelin esterase-like enzyme
MKTACSAFPIAVSLALFLGAAAFSQTPAPDGLVSPEVRHDRTVTFRIRAPKASEVTLYGDWMPPGKPEPMTKDPDGVWGLITAPLEATGHLYWFNVDGVAMADPVNPVIKRRQRTSASLVEVPAASPAVWELRDVPHGTVVTEWRKSNVLNRTERVILYLPPDYEKSKTRYPILYLNHGSGDIPESWVEAGHANLILDNLIAEGKAKPMIVVMPAGHALPFGARPNAGVSNDELFDRYLTTEVMPAMETKYRVAPGSRNRALAGLSMGGSHTIYTGFHHPGDFSALGIFSPGLFHVDSEMRGAQPALIWISCGDVDTTVQYPRVKAWAESLDKAGIRETFRTYQGAHTWPVWRESLAEFLPLIFDGGR